MDLAQERGASSWLTILPLEEFGLTLHKGAFRDAIALRYGWQPALIPSTCACGTSFSVEHALSCPMGGFPIVRHNEVRDLTAKLMSEVYHDVCIEPTLQPITSEALSGASAITEDGARLDVAANGFWGGRFDVKVFNPHAPSNRQPLSSCHRKHENIKKLAYEQRSRARLLHSPRHVPYCWAGKRRHHLLQEARLSLLSSKREQPYCSTMAWINCSLSFSLLFSSIRCIRGARSAAGHASKQLIPPIDLVSTEAKILFFIFLFFTILFQNPLLSCSLCAG